MEASERALTVIEQAIQSTQRAELEGGEASPRRLAVAAWAAFHGLATLVVDGQLEESVDDEDNLVSLTNSVTDVIYRGLSYSGL